MADQHHSRQETLLWEWPEGLVVRGIDDGSQPLEGQGRGVARTS